MGVDLRLLVVDGNLGHWGFAHTVLNLDRDYDLHEAINAMNPQLRPAWKLSTWAGQIIPDGKYKGERTYGDVESDPYGDPLKYLTSQQVAEAFDRTNNLSPMNKAYAACVKAMPKDTLIGLYWH